MRIVLCAFIYASLLLAVGCGEPTIDTTSDNTTQESMQRVRASLPESKREEFDSAIQVLAFSNIDFANIMEEGADGAEEFVEQVRGDLDGKTGEEVLAEARAVIAEREIKEKRQALAEIKELVAKQQSADLAKEELRKFEVIRSRFYKRQREYSGEEPIIELTVRNGMSEAVSRAYFEGVIASPGRSVPWLKESFNYSISGGLEPGEEASWNLAPNRFSEWGRVDAPADAVFTATVIRLDGADESPLFEASGLSEYELQRLDELKIKYGVE